MKNNQNVTITTVAKEVGMSIAAVSRAFDKNSKLKEEKRTLILETAKKMGYRPNKMAARLSCPQVRIGVLIYGEISAYYNDYIKGVNQSFLEKKDYKVECDLVVLEKSKYPIFEAYRVIERFINEKYDGVILSGFDGKSNKNKINKLKENNIPFILLDHDILGVERDGVSMNDSCAAGKLAAQLIGVTLGENRTVAVLCSDLDNISQKELTDSFCRASAEYGVKVTEVLPTFNNPDTARELTEKLLNENIGGIYVSTANSVSVCEVVKSKNTNVSLVCSDVFSELVPFIEDKTVFATVYQDPFNQAYKAFESLFENIINNKKTDEYMTVKPLAVFKSNLELYI